MFQKMFKGRWGWSPNWAVLVCWSGCLKQSPSLSCSVWLIISAFKQQCRLHKSAHLHQLHNVNINKVSNVLTPPVKAVKLLCAVFPGICCILSPGLVWVCDFSELCCVRLTHLPVLFITFKKLSLSLCLCGSRSPTHFFLLFCHSLCTNMVKTFLPWPVTPPLMSTVGSRLCCLMLWSWDSPESSSGMFMSLLPQMTRIIQDYITVDVCSWTLSTLYEFLE